MKNHLSKGKSACAALLAGLLVFGLTIGPADSMAKTSVKPVKNVTPAPSVSPTPLKSFANQQALTDYIHSGSRLAQRFNSGVYTGMMRSLAVNTATVAPIAAAVSKAAPSAAPMVSGLAADSSSQAASGGSSPDYSTTNIQVEGVDEADIVKSDGKYLYIAANNTVFLVEAAPADKAQVLSRIKLTSSPAELFIKGDRLSVISPGENGETYGIALYNVTNREKPELLKTVQMKGTYITSRLIGNYAYVVMNTWIDDSGDQAALPYIVENGNRRVIPPNQIYYFGTPDSWYQYTSVLAVNLVNDKEGAGSKTFLTGTSQSIYASEKNLYLTAQKTPDYVAYVNKMIDQYARMLPKALADKLLKIKTSGKSADEKIAEAEEIITDYVESLDYDLGANLEEKIRELQQTWQNEMTRDRQKTVVQKLTISGSRVSYGGSGEVQGSVLNQFSMDEYQGYFRIATTSQPSALFTTQSGTRNNIFVLDGNMKVVGKVQGLAPGERIYSARFMGRRAYLVTFRQTDPLFVIDLGNPKAPRVLGQLKIPGFSNYLHPVDDTHIIGIGKEVSTGEVRVEPLASTPAKIQSMVMPPITRTQGVKVALFDVSSPASPREMAKYVVDGYSNSSALYDHRAFLFSRSKELMVLPIDISQPYTFMKDSNAGAAQPWSGAYVFRVSKDYGLTLKGKIQHEDSQTQSGDQTGLEILRSMYIDNTLYTVSGGMVKMNELTDLRETGKVRLTP